MRDTLELKFTSTANSRNNLVVKIHWGIDGLDREGVGAWNVTDIGKLIWSTDFDISPAENQQALLDLCADMRTRDDLVQRQAVTCWIEEFKRFVDEQDLLNIKVPIESPELFN